MSLQDVRSLEVGACPALGSLYFGVMWSLESRLLYYLCSSTK